MKAVTEMKSVASVFLLCLVGMSASAEEPNKWKKPEGEPLFMTISRTDQVMLQAYEQARTTFPRFLTAIAKPQFADATNAVKIKILDDQHSADMGEDRFVYLWLYSVVGRDGVLSATVRELPKESINGLVVGSTINFQPEEVHDWMIIENGVVWGAFTLRVVRGRMGDRERAQYDEYTGITSYKEEEP